MVITKSKLKMWVLLFFILEHCFFVGCVYREETSRGRRNEVRRQIVAPYRVIEKGMSRQDVIKAVGAADMLYDIRENTLVRRTAAESREDADVFSYNVYKEKDNSDVVVDVLFDSGGHVRGLFLRNRQRSRFTELEDAEPRYFYL